MSWQDEYDEVLTSERWYCDDDVLERQTYAYLRQTYRCCSAEIDLSLIKIRKGSLWGIADAQGNVLVPPQFEGIGVLPECSSAFLIWAWNDEKSELLCGLADRTGRVLLPPQYDVILSVKEDCALVSEDAADDPVWLDWKGCVLGQPEWRYAEGYWDFHSGIKRVTLDGKIGHVDLLGRIIGGEWWDDAGEFGGSAYCSSAYAAAMTWVKRDGQYGFINLRGELVVAPVFDEVTDFGRGYDGLHCIMDNDRAAVRLGSRWGYISDTGELVVDCIWDEADEYVNGCASVRKGKERATLDISGQPVVRLDENTCIYTGDAAGHPFAISGAGARLAEIRSVIDGLNVIRRVISYFEPGWTPRVLLIYICGRIDLLELLQEAVLSDDHVAGEAREQALYDEVIPVLRRTFEEKHDCTVQEKEELDAFLLDAAERYLAPDIARWRTDETARNRHAQEQQAREERAARLKKRREEIREERRKREENGE